MPLGKAPFQKKIPNKTAGLAEFYTKVGSLRTLAGKDNLVSAWQGMIQRARDNGTPRVKFTTNGISTDGELVAELGKYEYLDEKDEAKKGVVGNVHEVGSNPFRNLCPAFIVFYLFDSE